MDNLSYYNIFYAVAKNGNLSRAAEELYISQPAISKSIKKLEEMLETNLFTRSSRGVTLTDEGSILFEHLKSAFTSIQEGEQKIKRNRELEIGHIRIGVSTTLCKHIMLPLLQNFVKENPHITVTIDCLSSSNTAERLTKNMLDVGLLVETAASKQLHFDPLTQLSYTFVASKQYLDNLHLREGINYTDASADLFSSATMMLMDRGNISREHAENYLRNNDIETGQIFETSNMELLVEFAKIGLGIGCVIRNFVEDDIKNGTLIEIPLLKEIPTRTVGFAYSKDSESNPSVKKFQSIVLS